MTAQRIIRTYYGIAATTTLAQALIWGVNTLFLLSVGFDIFEVMLINAAYTVAQVVFEVPTGVVADTVGRRVSYLLAVATILVSTLLYVGFGLAGYGLWPFAAASALLGVGYTFYTGAVDAWMVDALHSVGYEGKLEPIFARYGITFGIFMLIGTTLGGVLGQVDLWIPYVTRAVVLVPAFLLGLLVMRDLGFKGRALTLGSFGARDAPHRPGGHHGTASATGRCASSCSPRSCRASSSCTASTRGRSTSSTCSAASWCGSRASSPRSSGSRRSSATCWWGASGALAATAV